MPPTGAAVGPLGVLDPFDLGVAHLLDHLREHLEKRLLVRRRHSREEAAHELDILLRHGASIAQTRRGNPLARLPAKRTKAEEPMVQETPTPITEETPTSMAQETPTLYVCHGDDGGPRMHPCRRVQEALRVRLD